MDSLKVAVRVRPLLSGEKSLGLKGRWICTNSSITLDQSSTCYVFDRVFDEQISSSTVYNELALDIVKQAMEGFNGTIFTYGQSGSGKTYTLDALRTFAIKTIYEYIENCPTREFLLRVSYVELYNERFYDLLADNAILLLREDLDRNVFLEGLKEEIITSQSHVAQVLAKGNERRHIAETKLNNSSSRSHCIFRMVIESRERKDAENSSVYVSHLNLVDLAGSEKAGENSGDRFREGCGINKSLSTLALVIRKLSEEDSAFINYRDSKLTRILQNALGGNSKTAILCTVSPTSVEETHSTLRFGLNAKKVKNKPEQNEVLTDRALLKKSQQEIEKLKAVIKKLESGFSAQTDDELKEQKMKQQQLTEQLRSILCVSSKVNIEKKERNRRQTVCVPQISRFTAMKDLSTVNIPFSPAIRKKVSFDTKPNENIVAPTAPGAEDQSINHSLSSPCRSHECKCRDLSFTDFEQAFVEEALVQKFKTQINILTKENRQLKVRIQQMHGGLDLDPNESSVYNMSLGPDFHVTHFSIDEHDSEGIEGARPNLVSNESFVQYELELTDESAQAKFKGKNVDNSFSKRHRYSRSFKGDDSVFESSFLKPKLSRISDLIEEDESEDVSDKNKYDTAESNTTDVSINEEVDCHKDELDKLALDYERSELERERIVLEKEKENIEKLRHETAEQMANMEDKIEMLNNIEKDKKFLEEERKFLQESYKQLEDEKKILKELHEELSKGKDSLDDKLKAESCFTSEEKASMVTKCETEIANLQNIIDVLNREKKCLEEDKARESAEYEKQIEHLHKCIDELKIERDTMVMNNESAVSNYKTELLQFQAFLEQLKQDRVDLANEKAGLFAKHEMDVKQFKSYLEEMKKDRDDKENEIMKYKQQIAQLSSLLKDKESEICVSATEVTKYEAELKQLRNYFDALVEEKDQQLLKNKTDINDLQKMVDELKKTRDISAEEMVEEISKYKTELAQLHDLHSQLKNERDATLEQMKQMEEQQREFNQAEYLECIQEWQAECEARSTELEEAMKEIENCKKTITWGKQILATRDQEKQEAAKKCEEIEQQVESLKAELHTKSEECSRLQGKVNTHFSNLREIETLKKEVKELNRALQGSKEYYEGVINNLKMKLRNNADSSFAEQRVPSQPVPSIDHLRKIIEFENASKFLELSDLRKKTAEQETKYRNLQTEFTCLKSECEKLKEMQENECMRNEALFSMLNQKSSQLHKSQEELSKFKQSAPLKDKTEGNENTIDNESTSMLKNSLKESENVNRELQQKIERRDMKWNTLYPKYKSLLEKNCAHEKKIIHLTEEIAELKETLQKIKRAAGQEQVVEKVEPQAEQAANRRDSSRSSQQAEVNQMQPASASKRQHSARSDQENSHITKHLSGGVVENFIVISHERQIKEQQKEINRLKEKLKTFEQSKHQSSENSSNTLEFKLN
ncbi:uncharacterized protein LOC131952148 [Physella acuta]|uniref:uncharacterized protein LOC131952148 n=1 Tax=Physella acuta TaxID=109671 RepID=UPI0027DB8429|nr:uncharacterized protein LOC131952148 [Physella acuta]